MNHDRHDLPRLAPDDPRLSEWLDGRLAAAEAAEIERLVAASPELTRLVEDLRGLRGALGAVPVTPPPVGFVRDVLAAVDAAGAEAADEAEVEEEWRRIERDRLEGEIAEAREDAAEPAAEPMRQRWPWLALAAALAAGVLVAVAINRPGGVGDREVALAKRDHLSDSDEPPAQLPARKAAEDAFAAADLEEGRDLGAAEPADALVARPRSGRQNMNADSAKAETPPGGLDADGGNGRAKLSAALDAALPNAAAVAEDRERAPARQGAAYVGNARALAQELMNRKPGATPAESLKEAERQLAATAQGPAGRGAGIGGGGGGGPLAPDSAPAAPPVAPPAAAFARAAVRAEGPPIRTVTYRIRSAADRERLDALLADSRALGNSATDKPGGGPIDPQGYGGKVRRRPIGIPGGDGEPASGLPTTVRIEIVGSAAAIDSLAAALEANAEKDLVRDSEREELLRMNTDVEGGGKGKQGSGQQQGSQPAEPSAQQPADGLADETQDAGLLVGAPAEVSVARAPLAETAAAKSQGQAGGEGQAGEPEALLVIEVVDETLTEAGEGRP